MVHATSRSSTSDLRKPIFSFNLFNFLSKLKGLFRRQQSPLEDLTYFTSSELDRKRAEILHKQEFDRYRNHVYVGYR